MKPSSFNISHCFQAKTPLSHSVFGWGWIINNKNDRLEVIFKDKIRILLSNQPQLGSRGKVAKNKVRNTK